MHGNVWEWCWDLQNQLGSSRVIRGGCWDFDAALCRAAARSSIDPTSRSFNLGFRLALSPSGIPKPPVATRK